MLKTVFATKLDMTQAWSTTGKRLAVTKCHVGHNLIVNKLETSVINKQDQTKQQNVAIFEIGYGDKKLKNMSKPLRSRLQQSGFSEGVKQIKGVRVILDELGEEENLDQLKVGETISLANVLEVGDVVAVQGVTKGRGFAGVVKRHGFAGGPRTHGQSDRLRAPGSIGAGTDPGRVWPGMKMAGHYGVDNKTIRNLTVLHLDQESGEVWLSGPVPGHLKSIIKITKTGRKKEVALDRAASGLPEEKPTEAPAETPAETPVETPVETPAEESSNQ